ncbi:hypothetical protein [Arthrobacter sp. 260]|uniref:hypothetical protein n=1 Tax=Arthrobacter sp. 260 TaxID=2735314 RepID=UPI0014931E55|nr:hypothetical protein [Arthrobacter sp. 260]NOJ58328.1 hypothetical protein [Arthrobacter sp. 260]
MTHWLLAVRRAGPRRGLLTLILITIAFIAASLSTVVGHTQLAATGALREIAGGTFTEDNYFRLHTTTAADDASLQLEAAAAKFSDLSLDDGLAIASVPYADPRAVDDDSLPADLGVIPFGWIPSERTALIEGTLDAFGPSSSEATDDDAPTGPVPAAISETSAATLDLRVGDTLVVDGASGPITVEAVALVAPDGADGAFFLPVPSPDTNTGAGQPVVMAVPGHHLEEFSAVSKVQWVFTLDATTVSAAGLAGLSAGLADLPRMMQSDRTVSNGGLIQSGGLGQLLATATEATQSVKAVIPVALVLLTVLSAVTVVQVARLLSNARAVEDSLVAARGASATQRTALNALEIVPLASAGSLGGWLAAVVAVPLLSTGVVTSTGWVPAATEFALATWPIPLTCVAVATAAFVLPGWIAALRSRRMVGQPEGGRGTRVASFGLLAGVVALAGLSVWQFLLYGSPLSQVVDGRVDVNPLAAPAPALLLLALTATILVLVSVAARGAERHLIAGPGFALPFAAMQVSRRITSQLIPIALISLTVGGATFTAVYAETAASSQRAAAHLANGSAVRVSVPGPLSIIGAGDITDVGTFAALDGVSTASRVYRGPAKIGSEDVPLIALDSGELSGLLGESSSPFDVGRVAAALTPRPTPTTPDFELLAGTSTLELDLRTSPLATGGDGSPGASRNAALTVWLLDTTGQLVPVEAGSIRLPVAEAQEHVLTVGLPAGLELMRVAAIDFIIPPGSEPRGYSIELRGLTGNLGGGTGPSGFEGNSSIGLAPSAIPSGLLALSNLPAGVGVVFPGDQFQAGRVGARLMPDPLSQPPVPVAATTALLRILDLGVGDETTLRLGGVELEALISAEVPVVPGTTASAAVMVDLQAYGQAMLGESSVQPRPAELWLGAANPAAAESAAAAAATASRGTGALIDTANTDTSAQFLAPGTTALWLGTGGSLAISFVALMACVIALVRARAEEVAVLRAVGLAARSQARGRRGELQAVSAAAIVLGVMAGAAVSALLVGPLAEAVLVGAADTLRAPLRLAVVPLVAILLAQGLAVAGAAWYYGSRVWHQAMSAPVPGRVTG